MEIRFCSILLSFLFSTLFLSTALATKKVYIVYLGGHSHGKDATVEHFKQATDFHHELLGSFLESKEKAKEAIIYSYTKHINGFAAYIEEEEAKQISSHPAVISVFESKLKQLHTTRTWTLLGLQTQGNVPPASAWAEGDFGEDVIIAHLDTGVWPESESFRDDAMGPVPERWKGSCENSTKAGVMCNRKLIGAKYFVKGYLSQIGHTSDTVNATARDTEGHGTHTLSTLGGRFVPRASLFGMANGTAAGGSPRARVASYKVCWSYGCADADLIAGFDEAIDDGVDVLSVSIGGDSVDYFSDPIAVGSFHAAARGIVVACSAGNSGPFEGSVENTAPWVTTVAASTADRDFFSSVTLGNKKEFRGKSLCFTSLPRNKLYPLINSWEAKTHNASANESRLCYVDSLDPRKAKGKIVICHRGDIARIKKGEAVRKAGGVGMILVNQEDLDLVGDVHVIPATMISYQDGLALDSYMKSTNSPVGTISPVKTVTGIKPAPMMAAFSSRGPSLVSPQILKPDITAPGVQILASYTEAIPISDYFNRTWPFILMSGTSMSCPHIAGVMGLIRKYHPRWSPAAIRSAIMTTAKTSDNTGNPMQDADEEEATPFAYGSGLVQPNRAMNPGLVYDMGVKDYLAFLCSFGYNTTQLASFTGKPYRCPEKKTAVENLNNPSFAIPSLNKTMTVSRILKNVGVPGTYRAKIRAPPGIRVRVDPQVLVFKKVAETRTFKMTFASTGESVGRGYSFGFLVWSDGRHYVRSPMAVKATS